MYACKHIYIYKYNIISIYIYMDTYGYYTSRVEQMQEANLRIISYNFLNQSNHRQ